MPAPAQSPAHVLHFRTVFFCPESDTFPAAPAAPQNILHFWVKSSLRHVMPLGTMHICFTWLGVVSFLTLYPFTFAKSSLLSSQSAFIPSSVESVGINVHLTFAAPLLSLVTSVNARLQNETIRFPRPHTPHVTLYMSQFFVSSMPAFLEAIEEAIASPTFASSCSSSTLAATVAGRYIMLPVALNGCLQSMSDTIVTRTHHLALPNQTAPDWLSRLPEPQRSAKMRMLNLFGSPNVFSQYDPHITLACAANVSELDRAVHVFDGISLPFNPVQIRVSRSGACGTALSDETLLSVDLFPPSNSNASVSNSSCAAFRVVSLQTSSNSSCSEGHTHVWPLLPVDHCHGWSAVDEYGAVHKNSANNIRCNSADSFSFVQFTGSLDCSGSGSLKTFYSGECIRVGTSLVADFMAALLCSFVNERSIFHSLIGCFLFFCSRFCCSQDNLSSLYTIPLDLTCCASPKSSACVNGMPSALSGSALVYMNGLACTPAHIPLNNLTASKFGPRAILTAVASALFAGFIAALATFVVEKLGGVKGGILAATPTTILPALIGMRSNSSSPEDFSASIWLLPVGALCNSFFLATWRYLPPRIPRNWPLRRKCAET